MKGSFFLDSQVEPRFGVHEMSFSDLSPQEVLVKVMSCGICGTDVHIFHGEEGSAAVAPPVVLGHEFSGVITEIGTDVTGIKVGDHVAMDPNMYCGKCIPCRMGKKQNCEHLFALGVNTNGGFAQYCVCLETQCFKVSDELDFDAAAMTEPLACAIHGIDNVEIKSGQFVLVIGGGPIGLIMIQLAKLSGASAVILSEPVEFRRKLGLELGADAVIDSMNEDVSQKIMELYGREDADVVIECVGKPATAAQAIQLAGFSGRVLLFSVPQVDASIQLPLFDVYKKELHIVGSMINPDTHQRAINLLNTGKVKVKELISHTYGLYQVEEAIKKQMQPDSVKVVVHPQED